ncbi:hypothetical protein HHK36_000938 [Tetracentron sinense]|uniref:Uncharacterized protein n=1 Tax=Tetracentron sinense TaxID=13715 RepID=A0A835DR61_TETSI|nr:hypothetical protein HHK36_000938 [Tetracentron sinense]
MAPKSHYSTKNCVSKGAWTPEEDRILAQFIEIHGAKRWKTVAAKAGLYLDLKTQNPENETRSSTPQENWDSVEMKEESKEDGDSEISFDVDAFLNFSSEGSFNLEWVNKFLESNEGLSGFS